MRLDRPAMGRTGQRREITSSIAAGRRSGGMQPSMLPAVPHLLAEQLAPLDERGRGTPAP